MKHLWKFQLGPFAEHTVEIVKKYTLGNIITLLVDGEVLVEATASDLGLSGGEWKCNFKFVGERLMDFELFTTNKDGLVLPETTHVEQKLRYTHECSVVIPSDWEFSTGVCRADTAQFFIDGRHFSELKVAIPSHKEQDLSLHPRALQQVYNINTPYAVNPCAPSSAEILTKHVLKQAEDQREAVKQAATTMWQYCCQPSHGQAYEQV